MSAMTNPLPTLLVVDDDAAIRGTVSDILELEDYAVEQAANGESALALIEERAARGVPPPDAILLDMRMPVMDGWEFARRYRTLPGPHAPIVVMTAARDAGEWGREVGAAASLGKPFGLQDLLDTVSSLISADGRTKAA
jgi:two-component system, chemotaxis family, chemotaxis protein CheY